MPMKLLLGRTLKPKIAKRFGGRMKAMVPGGAPLNPEIGIFFQSLGLTFLQGYGQTEAAPALSCNPPSAGLRMDIGGPPAAAPEARIADDRETHRPGHVETVADWRKEGENQN